MKRITLIFFVLLSIFATQARSDYYFKWIENSKSYGSGVLKQANNKKEPIIEERWWSKDRQAKRTPHATIALDLTKKKVYVLLHKSKNYLVTNFPVDPKSIYSADLLTSLTTSKTNDTPPSNNPSTYMPTNKSTKIMGLTCQAYELNTEGLKSTLWMTQDFNITFEMCGLFSSDCKDVEDKGVEVMDESVFEIKILGSTLTTISKKELVQFDEISIPDELISIPVGYKKVEKIDKDKWLELMGIEQDK